jgi:predicted transcriptional regulator
MAPQHDLDVGPLEMKVLGLLESEEAKSVSDIQTLLTRTTDTPLAYTTVMTVLVRLHQKGYLEREKEGRQFFYRLTQGKRSSSQKLFERVKRSLFRNQRLEPILTLLDSDHDLTVNELKDLRRAVDAQLKKTRPKT